MAPSPFVKDIRPLLSKGFSAMPLTPRERVLTAINHEEPDRVPIVLGVSNATGIKMKPYRGIKELCGISARMTTSTTGRNWAPRSSMKRPCAACTAMCVVCSTWSPKQSENETASASPTATASTPGAADRWKLLPATGFPASIH